MNGLMTQMTLKGTYLELLIFGTDQLTNGQNIKFNGILFLSFSEDEQFFFHWLLNLEDKETFHSHELNYIFDEITVYNPANSSVYMELELAAYTTISVVINLLSSVPYVLCLSPTIHIYSNVLFSSLIKGLYTNKRCRELSNC